MNTTKNMLGRIIEKNIPIPKGMTKKGTQRKAIMRIAFCDVAKEKDIFVEPFSLGNSNFVNVTMAITNKSKIINLDFVREIEEFDALYVQFEDEKGEFWDYVYAVEPGADITFVGE